MRKVLFFLTFSFISLCIGCSNSQNVKLSYTDSETVKDYVKNREVDVTWTKEIEGTRLTENISMFEQFNNIENINPDCFKILPEYKNPVFPSIENFGSLNITNLPENLKKNLNDFCKAISENIYSGPEKFIENKYIFNYVFFKNEIIDGWNIFFEEEFPVKPEDFEEKQAEKSEEEVKKELPPPVFSKWYLGEPFIGEELIEIPVRFFSKKGNIDVTIFMNTTNENSIYQIVINRWETTDGR